YRVLRQRVQRKRLPRPAQPLPQPRARLRMAAGLEGQADRTALPVHRRRPRSCDVPVRRGDRPCRDDADVRAEGRRPRLAGRGTLDAAGAAGRGQPVATRLAWPIMKLAAFSKVR
ncbi:MAG: hypothetical protein ACK4NZ_12380, partial [Tsuneonella sp.]